MDIWIKMALPSTRGFEFSVFFASENSVSLLATGAIPGGEEGGEEGGEGGRERVGERERGGERERRGRGERGREGKRQLRHIQIEAYIALDMQMHIFVHTYIRPTYHLASLMIYFLGAWLMYLQSQIYMQ